METSHCVVSLYQPEDSAVLARKLICRKKWTKIWKEICRKHNSSQTGTSQRNAAEASNMHNVSQKILKVMSIQKVNEWICVAPLTS